MDNQKERYDMACAYLLLGKKKEAKDIFFNLKLEGHIESTYQLGLLFREEGEDIKAIRCFKEASMQGHKASKKILDDMKVPAVAPEEPKGEELQMLISNSRKHTLFIKASSGRMSQRGTGFILDGGIIVTNAHVVTSSQGVSKEITGTFFETGKAYQLIPIYVNNKDEYDVAILMFRDDINIKEGLRLNLKNNLKMGDFVYTIGCPLGTKFTYSSGVVSNPSVVLKAPDSYRIQLADTVPLHDYIRLDFSINHGNSGGALFNSKGLVEGITTLSLIKNDEDTIKDFGFSIADPDSGFAEKSYNIAKIIVRAYRDKRLTDDTAKRLLEDTIKAQEIKI